MAKQKKGQGGSFFGKLMKKNGNGSGSSMMPIELTPKELMDELYSLNEKFDKVLVRISQVEGKLEMEEQSRVAVGDKISDATSQVGELRSIVVARERFMDKIDADMLKIKNDIQEISPKDIQLKFDKLDEKLIKFESRIVKEQNKSENMEERISSFQKQMDKIKSFENIFDMLQETSDKLKNIEHINSNIDRAQMKIDSIFSDLSQRANEISTHESRLGSVEKACDKISNQVEKLSNANKKHANKDELSEIQKQLKVIKQGVLKKEVVSDGQKADSKPQVNGRGEVNQAPKPAEVIDSKRLELLNSSMKEIQERLASFMSDLQKRSDELSIHESRLSLVEQSYDKFSKILGEINKKVSQFSDKKDFKNVQDELKQLSQDMKKSYAQAGAYRKQHPEARDSPVRHRGPINKSSSANEHERKTDAHQEALKKLKLYYESMKSKGISPEQLKQKIIESGWPKQYVENFLK